MLMTKPAQLGPQLQPAFPVTNPPKRIPLGRREIISKFHRAWSHMYAGDLSLFNWTCK